MNASKEYKEKIEFVADHYGYDAQNRQCMEECAELIESLNKHWRAIKFGTKRDTTVARENIIGELADVEFMVQQITYLIGGADEVEQILVQKVDRELERIKAAANKEICGRRDTPGIK